MALVFILSLAFNILPGASAANPAHDHSAPLADDYHWDCTLVPDEYSPTPDCGETAHEHGVLCYGFTCGKDIHIHSDMTCQAPELTCVTHMHTHACQHKDNLCGNYYEHTHTDGCYIKVFGVKKRICPLYEHTHTDSCFDILTCSIPEHFIHTTSCLTNKVCNTPEHFLHGASCVGVTCKTAEHTHSTANGCYELLKAASYTCKQVRDTGSVELTLMYENHAISSLFKSISVTLRDVKGNPYTASNNLSGVVTFSGIPTGPVTFDTITSKGLVGVFTYFAKPAGMTVEKDKTASGSVNLIMCYDHVDVYKNGTLLVDRQTNGISNGAPVPTAVTASNLSGSYTIGAMTTPLSFTLCGDEWRASDLTLVMPDSLTITCTLTDTSSNIYPFSHTYTGQELIDAINACPAHCPLKSGMDLTINEGYIVNTNKYNVTFKTDAGGTINGGTTDVSNLNITEGCTFPTSPTTTASADHTFDGWYDILNNKISAFPATVTATATYTARWTDTPYGVTYNYVSGTDGMSLPHEIATVSEAYAVSDTTKYTIGQAVPRNSPASSVYNVVDASVITGTWTLTNWTPDSATMISGGITFTGTWTYTPATKYDVTYQVTGDAPTTFTPDIPGVVKYYAGQSVPVSVGLTSSVTTKGALQGAWTFSGWKNGDATVSSTFEMPAGDVTLTGKWTFVETGKYLVSYTVTGGPNNSSPSVPDDISYYPNTPLTVATILTTTDSTNGTLKGKWTFSGWNTASDVSITEGSFKMPSYNVAFTGTWSFTEYASFTIDKIDENEKLIMSSGATFTLYKDSELTEVYGTYNTGNNGFVTIDGLDEGTYYLKETSAPAGYLSDGTVWFVYVSANKQEYTISEYNQKYNVTVFDSHENSMLVEGILTVMNEKAPTPPVTIDYGALTVDKTVSSSDTTVTASGTEKFAFTVTFTANPYNVLGVSNDAGLTGSNGVYTFTLSANDTPVTFSNIPAGTTYTVSEAILTTQTGWAEGASTGKTGTISTTVSAAEIANVFTPAVLGISDKENSQEDSGQGVAGETDKLPQTGGISPSTLLGILGLALVASGGTAFTILKKKSHGKDD